MAVDDRAGAASAAAYFLQLLEYAQAAADTHGLERLSSPDCRYCQAQIESIENRAESGGWIEGDPAVMEEVRVQSPTGTDPYVVRFVLVAPEATALSADGVIEEFPAQTFPHYAIAVEWLGDRFIVVGVNSDTTN